eukprot:scaffold3713_cov372-Prasinococcus_capsulatus_cf.AAC.16
MWTPARLLLAVSKRLYTVRSPVRARQPTDAHQLLSHPSDQREVQLMHLRPCAASALVSKHCGHRPLTPLLKAPHRCVCASRPRRRDAVGRADCVGRARHPQATRCQGGGLLQTQDTAARDVSTAAKGKSRVRSRGHGRGRGRGDGAGSGRSSPRLSRGKRLARTTAGRDASDEGLEEEDDDQSPGSLSSSEVFVGQVMSSQANFVRVLLKQEAEQSGWSLHDQTSAVSEHDGVQDGRGPSQGATGDAQSSGRAR